MDWFKRFGDPDFIYGRTLSQVTATALMRMADAPVLPFEFHDFARTVKGYVDEIKKQSGDKVNFQPVLDQLAKIEQNSERYDAALNRAMPDNANEAARVNDVLFHSERALTLTKGLPRRDWYKHQIYAPGMYTGYGAKTLPGIREAVESKNWPEANQEVESVAEVLAELDNRIRQAAELLAH